MILAASFVIAGPVAFAMGGMIIGGMSKRNLRKVFKVRYGDAYTIDATAKPDDDDVELPDEDEDEDDDDDNENDDDEDDDDE